MHKAMLGAAVVAALSISSAASAAVLDDFNRADAGTLGAGWTQQVGSAGISGNQATGTAGAAPSLATFNAGTGNLVSFDITNVGTDTQYIAAVLGYGAGTNIFVKVQNNGGTSAFDRYGFYTGNNGQTGPFGSLTTSFDTGHVEVSFAGTIATLTITPTLGAVQVYQHDYGFALVGNGTGLGFYGPALADNFGSGGRVGTPGVPEPASWAMMIAGLSLIGLSLRRRKVAASFA